MPEPWPWYDAIHHTPDADRYVIIEWRQDKIARYTGHWLPKFTLMLMDKFMLDAWPDRSHYIERWCYCPQ